MRVKQIISLAEDFVNMSWQQKIAIASELHILDTDDVLLDDDILEMKIWKLAMEDYRFSEFMLLVEHHANRSV